MKRVFSILFVLALLAGNQSFAQLAVDKGTKFLNAGIGVGGYGYFDGSGLGLNASFDAGVYKNITVGVVGGYRGYGSGVSSFDLGVRGSYHFNELLKLPTNKVDLYAGLGISYYRLGYGNSYYSGLGITGVSDSYSTTYVPFHLGGRYFFSDKIGAFAELGSSLATLKIGVTFKL